MSPVDRSALVPRSPHTFSSPNDIRHFIDSPLLQSHHFNRQSNSRRRICGTLASRFDAEILAPETGRNSLEWLFNSALTLPLTVCCLGCPRHGRHGSQQLSCKCWARDCSACSPTDWTSGWEIPTTNPIWNPKRGKNCSYWLIWWKTASSGSAGSIWFVVFSFK